MFNVGDTVTVHYAGEIPHTDVVREITPYGMIRVGNDWYRADGWLSNDGAGWIEEGVMTVLKQELEITEKAGYFLPGNIIKPLTVAEQNGNLVLYFQTDVDPLEISKSPKKYIQIFIVGTGRKGDNIIYADYLGTVVMSYGLVCHCYIRQ